MVGVGDVVAEDALVLPVTSQIRFKARTLMAVYYLRQVSQFSDAFMKQLCKTVRELVRWSVTHELEFWGLGFPGWIQTKETMALYKKEKKIQGLVCVI